jgi:hypothetical protein
MVGWSVGGSTEPPDPPVIAAPLAHVGSQAAGKPVGDDHGARRPPMRGRHNQWQPPFTTDYGDTAAVSGRGVRQQWACWQPLHKMPIHATG